MMPYMMKNSTLSLTEAVDCNKLLHNVTEEVTVYITRLVNFGMNVYEGHNLEAAMDAAVASGFECVVEGYGVIMAWSPISGWHMMEEMA